MIKLDDNLLAELGLGSLPKPEKTAFLKHMYETLEMRVGTRLAERMSEQQMSEFEQFISGNDEQGAFKWLEGNFPDYKDVVAEEFDKLKGEIRPLVPQIVSASQAQAAGVEAGQQQMPAQPHMDAPSADTSFGRPPMPPTDGFAHNNAPQAHYAAQPNQQQYTPAQAAPDQPAFAAPQPPQPPSQQPYGPEPAQQPQPQQQQPQPSFSQAGQGAPMQQQPPVYQQPTAPQPQQNPFGPPPAYNPAPQPQPQQPPAFGQPPQHQQPAQPYGQQPQPGFGGPQPQQPPQYGQQPPFTPPQNQ